MGTQSGEFSTRNGSEQRQWLSMVGKDNRHSKVRYKSERVYARAMANDKAAMDAMHEDLNDMGLHVSNVSA